MLENVAVLALDGLEPFGLGVLSEVWNEPFHPEDDCPTFDFAICTPTPGRVRGTKGLDLYVEHGLDRLVEADLVAVAATCDLTPPPAAASEALRTAWERGATVLAWCTGSFVLGASGLLDGRRCATHWRYADRLAAAFPQAHVEPDVLYVEDERVVTGAGSAAGIDACLHVMRSAFGARVAATTARRMVVPPHRDGGQSQYVRTPVPQIDAPTLEPVLVWAAEHLDDDLSAAVLAARAHMSARTFARRFRDETGTTPHQWVTTQRLALAEELLETTVLSVEQVAQHAGFGNAATLRHHFGQVRGTSPQAYRATFGARGA